MAKKMALLFLLICLGCDSRAQETVVYKKGDIIPEIIAADAASREGALQFCRMLSDVTGQSFEPQQSATGKSEVTIAFVVDTKLKDKDFSLKMKDRSVMIAASGRQGFTAASNYFISQYAGYAVPGLQRQGQITLISLPAGLGYSSTLAFEYREPYFPDNFDPAFRQRNNTHTLEDTWGLWGHNIGKAVTPTPKMFAVVNGRPNEEQFCFSSPELASALEMYIDAQLQENHVRNKFMVMPNDNDIVCQCSKCKAYGNTSTNASPAVYTLLNKLAAKFPAQEFFSTAYITTQIPPSFKTAANAGVIISTMAFPKGVVVGQSNKKALVDKTFADWKKVTDKIYLWDYAVNFDSYPEPYPTVLIAQQNLKYYKSLDVTGVFMQGSEDMYAGFADLKCYLYAQLLLNPETDVRKCIRLFFEAKYPSVANLLTGYYTAIEERALASNKLLDIYGGIAQARKKYLEQPEFDDFYAAIVQKHAQLPKPEADALKPLLAALTFVKLDLLRTEGIATGKTAEAKTLIERLRSWSAASGIKIYNESGLTVADYIAQWENEILSRPYTNLLYGKPIKFISKPDEDYANPGVLNDGAIGFNDYYNNWLLSTSEPLKVSINAADVMSAKTIEMAFLNDTRHRIYLPQRVVVTIDGRKYEAVVPAAGKLAKQRITIPVEMQAGDKSVIIEVIKQDDYKGRATACDELFFR